MPLSGLRTASEAGAAAVLREAGFAGGPGVVAIAAPRRTASTAFLAHEPNSVVSTEWPVCGTTTTVASGIIAATASALEVGVRRSSAPLMISVGTFGRAVIWVSGAALRNGQ